MNHKVLLLIVHQPYQQLSECGLKAGKLMFIFVELRTSTIFILLNSIFCLRFFRLKISLREMLIAFGNEHLKTPSWMDVFQCGVISTCGWDGK